MAHACRGEVEYAGVLQEKRPLLGEEDREAGQVDLPVVDLGFAKVRVDGRREPHARRDVVKQIESRFAAQHVIAVGRRVYPT